jgi:hypothetical protein
VPEGILVPQVHHAGLILHNAASMPEGIVHEIGIIHLHHDQVPRGATVARRRSPMLRYALPDAAAALRGA